MSYVAQGFTDEQARTLSSGLDMSALAQLPPEKQVDLLLRQQAIKAERTRALWEAIGSALTLMAFLGFAGARR
jgi:hypothetical protein